ncbi:unnamed protein product [Rhizoctonia solani]|uniref:EVE domain-containing protein n=1 Tax=Rhizoctonia solani TaxID=456999 RepID=A0A8H3AI57_9AGAM|nr:unnamed protein product [Rhizoctonia solani]
MGHGLGSDSDSDLSSAPPSPRLGPSTPRQESSASPAPPLSPGHTSLPPPSPPQPQPGTRERSLSSVTGLPWKTRPRAKRQLSTSAPNPPSSPKRRKQNGKGKGKDVVETGNDITEKGHNGSVSMSGKGKDVAGTRGKVGKIKLQVKNPHPAEIKPDTKDSTLIEEKTSTSSLSKTVSPAPWKSKIPPPPGPANSKPKPAPFAKVTSKPKLAPESTAMPKPIVTTSKSTSSKLAGSSTKPTPLGTSKPAPVVTKSTRTTKRPVYTESDDFSHEEEEENPKKHKRRKSHALEAAQKPKPNRKPRVSLPPQPDSTAGPLELRPASFLTKTNSFLTKPVVPSARLNLQPREDVWNYDDLTGLTWVKLDTNKCEIVPGSEQGVTLGEQWCWWPAEVKQNTSNGLKLTLCGLEIERELTPNAAAESNILTFRKPNSSSVRFPAFKTAFSPPVIDVESPNLDNELSGEPSALTTGESSTPPTGGPSSILPTSPSALETSWKQALTRAFEIDTESNDGLEDILLLFSQKSKSPRDDDEQSGNTAPEDQSPEQEQSEDEDVLENGTTVLCRYRTRYYPAKIISYHPREGKSKRRFGLKGKYKCMFADESTKMAARPEIMTTLDEGFVTCSLGSYQRYSTTAYQKPTGIREPSPAPRADSPAPEPEDVEIDPREYCSRERIRDQLKPVLPFLKGLIERRYIPGKGVTESTEDSSGPEVKDNSPAEELDHRATESSTDKEPEPVLDRHAIFIQGGRARKNLAYSVYTGDLNEDDCEELMFELSRWALRGERWACEEVGGKENGGNQEGRDESTSRVAREGQDTGQVFQESNIKNCGEIAVENGATSGEPEREETDDPDVDMQGSSQETNAGQDSQSQAEGKSGDTTELEDEPLTVVKIFESIPSAREDFRSLVKLQPPRPTGAPDYEALTAEERMGYVSDVLYPEAAALILSYRRGIRTQPGPLLDQAAEHALYTAGQEAAKNNTSTSDWVEQILSIRQLREANSKYQVEEQAQVVVSGGTRSRPRYMTSFSVDDFEACITTAWEGVRNHEAKNIMRDQMKVGDKVSKEAFPDHTANDPTHPYYDAKSSSRAPKSEPTWWMVELKFKSRLKHFVSLATLRSITSVSTVEDLAQLSTDFEDGKNQLSYLTKDDLKALGAMPLLNRGRLSVQPVNEGAWIAINKLAEKGGWNEQTKPKLAKGASRSGKSTRPAKAKTPAKRKASGDEDVEDVEDDSSENPNVDAGSFMNTLRRSKRRRT